MAWELIIVVGAIVLGAGSIFLVLRRQTRAGASGCHGCPYGESPSECEASSEVRKNGPNCELTEN